MLKAFSTYINHTRAVKFGPQKEKSECLQTDLSMFGNKTVVFDARI